MKTLTSIAVVLTVSAVAQPAMVEPGAGNWKTFAISSAKDYRVPPPPDERATRDEIAWLKQFSGNTDPRIEEQIRFWDAGAPSYRWVDMMVKRQTGGQPMTAFPHRVFTYVTMAMHDATIAAWESKYHYNRPRPSEVDNTLRPRLAVPRSPSYPSEHAAAAGAAAAVLAALLPAEGQVFQAMAEEAARSRTYAGLQYPSDYFAGLELGRRVAEKVLEKARADGSDAVWTGVVPTGACMWTGTNPGNATMPNWRPILLSSPSEFRSPPPPGCQTDAVRAETDAVKNFPRTLATTTKAFYFHSVEGTFTDFHMLLSRLIAEDRLDQNPPRAARAYAAMSALLYDTWIASNDSKYAYWFPRPHMLDSGITPLFPAPNFPSYPSNHSALSTARAELLGHMFPDRKDAMDALGRDAGNSRIWAGIHYEMDNQAGSTMGKATARKYIAWMEGNR